jgi:anthranilate phosphoribosyltransferase
MIEQAIKKLVLKEDLGVDEAMACMHEMMQGLVSPVKTASFLTGLKMKGETEEELFAFATIMRENALPIPFWKDETYVDTCGTGGDGIHTFNISTTAMFIAAGAGVKMAKHGNRSMTSQCGAADVLEGLGARVDLSSEDVARCIHQTGIGFMFAPIFHASMKHVSSVRRELGFRTVFNVLGPLSNPANARCQLLGVFDRSLVKKVAGVLNRLQLEKAMVVHGMDGMDEITLTGPTFVAELREGEIREYEIHPEAFGFSLCCLEDLRGGGALENAAILEAILKGERGPKSDVSIINAGAAIYISGLAKTLTEGISYAKESIATKKAWGALMDFIKCSNEDGAYDIR